ncbi:hypothetical protein GTO36_01000, partial [bacterium]|nr:hypothetical protein [bacterium]
TAKEIQSEDEVTWNSFIFAFTDWVKNSVRFKDPERWLVELKEELTKIPKFEREIENLRLQIDVSMQSLLLDEGFNTDEIFELMKMSTTTIDIIDSDGGLQEWRKNRRKQHF